jgi:nicotinamidase-related amidase
MAGETFCRRTSARDALSIIPEEMPMTSALRFGTLGPSAVHLCIDMQTLFAERTDWHVPWLERVLPAAIRLAEAWGARTVFTRFVPPERPEQAVGAWRRYYEHWRHMAGDQLNPRLIELVPPLAALARPDLVIDKAHYSPFKEPAFLRILGQLRPDALVISGGETDVCALGTVMDAIDAGYRVILAADALCSVSDESHDAMLRHFGSRFSHQVEVASTDEILAGWRAR